MERGMVANAKIHSIAPNVVIPSTAREKVPSKGTYIRAGINNKAYAEPNRLPKNLATFLTRFESFLVQSVTTLLKPLDNVFENVLIDRVNECMLPGSRSIFIKDSHIAYAVKLIFVIFLSFLPIGLHSFLIL